MCCDSGFICVDGRSSYLYNVLGASYVHPVFNHVVPHQYLIPTVYLYVADITNPVVSPGLFSTSPEFGLSKKVNRSSIAGTGRFARPL